jgi:hypothetical protein
LVGFEDPQNGHLEDEGEEPEDESDPEEQPTEGGKAGDGRDPTG